jgi:hypothetical protein
MTDDLVKRLLDVALRQRAQLDSIQKANRNHFPMMRGLQRRVAELEAERDRNAEYVDLVSRYRAERDAAEAERDDYKRSATHSEDVVRAARAEIERLRAIGTEMAESIQGNYYLPSVATRWFTALKGQRPEPWPSSALKEAVDFAEQTFPYLAQKDNSHE